MWIQLVQDHPQFPEIIKLSLDDMVARIEFDMIESIISLKEVTSFLLGFQYGDIVDGWKRRQVFRLYHPHLYLPCCHDPCIFAHCFFHILGLQL